MGGIDVVAFLSDLAVRGRVTASTQNQALAALLFLYRAVLGREVEGLGGSVRARRPQPLPVVLARDAWAAMEALRGEEGARAVLAAHPEWLAEVPIAGAPPRDIDDAEDYRQALAAAGGA